MAPVDSLRLAILKTIQGKFASADFGVIYTADVDNSETDPMSKGFARLGPLTEQDNRFRWSFGVVAQRETYGDLYPFITRELEVALEFRFTVNRGDEGPAILIERMLLALEQVVINNRDWSGLALDTRLTGNEIDMASYSDKAINGVLFVTVQYRHNRFDPTDADPSG